ncbi:CYFA0S01e20252g1_1 [Cyberlindnera fabianii]|uniref:poly(A)-specific ribonuclease n=1 Tax=Cyberlindnera fabianii TaxID=36022 RepID=A0A061ARR0_CYBFA|nr:CYFA0S01e20252g1_1 [Cyberlindnera fabianii]
MSFTHIPPQAELSQAAQLQKLTQFQQMQQMSNFSPQIPQRGLNHPAMLAQQPPAPQAQVPQAQLIIKEVWADNLHKELQTIRQLITSYNYVSFSTEFPGILARPIGVFSSTDDYHYQTLRTNADLLDLIQFGVSLTDANGNRPEHICSTWQFNFKFDLNTKMISDEAYESLTKTGIDFHKHMTFGIDHFEFAELLTSSGLVLLPDVHWASFHAGYDFGFLLALLTNDIMAGKEDEFLHKISLFFPNLYDLKVLSKHTGGNKEGNLKPTLESLADELGIQRATNFVSTGGQALLTSFCLSELKKRIPDMELYAGEIHGLKNDGLAQGAQLNSLGGDH